MKLILSSILFFCSIQNLISQNKEYDSLVTIGIHQIYSIEFKKAESTFHELKIKYPDKPAGNFFEAMIIWWKILLDLDNEEFDDLFVDKLQTVIDQCDEIIEKDPDNVDAYFFKGGSLGFRGRLNSIRGNWFDAAADGKDALPLVFTAYELDSTNIDVKLGFGIYDYYAAVIPEQYPIVQPLMFFFPEGNKYNGISALKNVAEDGKYAKYEAQYFLMTLNYSYEKNSSESYKYAKMLYDQFPDNPRFQSFMGRLNIRMNNYPSAIIIFEDILRKAEKNYYGYNDKIQREAHYYIGLNYKRTDSLNSAMKHFVICEKLSRKIDKDEESGFLINTILYEGEIYDLTGNRQNAIKKYKEVLDLDEFGDSHKRATDNLKKPFRK